MELRFVNTCPACPEQYDVFDNEDNTQVGYVRLRHGYLSVRYVDEEGNQKELYGAYVKGDGTFSDKAERKYYLEKAAEEIDNHLTYMNDFDSPGDFVILV